MSLGLNSGSKAPNANTDSRREHQYDFGDSIMLDKSWLRTTLSTDRCRVIKSLEYGGIDIDDPKTWALFAACIENHIPLTITNMIMGKDTAPSGLKTARMEYIFNGLRKIRKAKELDTIYFNYDIEAVMYGTNITGGPTVTKPVAKMPVTVPKGSGWYANDYYILRPTKLEPMFECLDSPGNNGMFKVNNSTLLGFNTRDVTQPGVMR